MSLGSVSVLSSYVSVVGELRQVVVLGMTVRRMAVCRLGSCFDCWSCSVIVFRFSCSISFRSLFLYRLCRCMLSVVGFCMRCSWSLCCFVIIRLNFGVHQGLCRRCGVVSWCSMHCWRAVWRMCSRWEGLVWYGVCMCVMIRVCWSAGSMVYLCFSYLLLDRVFCLFSRFRGVGRWNMA